MSVLAIALLLAALYFMVWRPAAQFQEQAAAQHKSARELLAWMQSNQPAIRSLAAGDAFQTNGSTDKPADGRALMALVNRTARESELALQRFEPGGENSVRLWLDSAPFAEVAAWLEQLVDEYGVVIDQATMDRTDEPGVVSVRLTLTI